MSIATDLTTQRLIDELSAIDGKAEIVGGRIVCMSPTGEMPGGAAGAIHARLREYARKNGGRAYGGNVAILTDLPNRKSFCPDAAYYIGPRASMKFLPEAPIFAVEVRSEGDYGSSAEPDLTNKRADCFAAGTKVVWDVDLRSDNIVRKYSVDAPDSPVVFQRGEIADAEPAAPGWKFAVDELFD